MKLSKGVAVLGAFLLSASILGSTAATATPHRNSIDVSVALVTPEPLSAPTDDALTAATNHLGSHAHDWGIDPTELDHGRVSPGIAGMSTVRFTQRIKGIEVLGSLVAITVSHEGSLLSYRIKTGQGPSDLEPVTTSSAAQLRARTSQALEQQLKVSDVVAVSTTLAIADPRIVDFVTDSSKLVWVVKIQPRFSHISSTTLYLDAMSLATLRSVSSIQDLAAPLVCDLQLMDNSYAAFGQSRSLQRITASLVGSARKARSGEYKLKGVVSSRIWLVAMTSYAGGVSTSYRSFTIPRNGIVTYNLKFSNVAASATYSLFVGTGKTRPTQSKMIRIKSGPVKSSIVGKVQGTLPRTGSSLRTSLLVDGKTVSFLALSAQSLPLCNYNNAGVTKTSTNATSRLERANATRFINGTQQYFDSVLGIDIFAEMYLGNISPKLNFGRTANCGTGQNAASETGDCSPRVSAFTNVCINANDSLSCPEYGNAFWTYWDSLDCRSTVCSAIFIGRGFVADDVVAHELAHGVSGYAAFNSTMSNDAESLSEAYSDFFGEAFDQLNSRSGEAADLNWGMGEDVTGSSPGPFREMRETGPDAVPYYGGGCWVSSGDEHYNNGPADRFAWLISNGGTNEDVNQRCLPNSVVRAMSVSAIGTTPSNGLCATDGSDCTAIRNMSRLVFTALPNISSAATYRDFGRAIVNACTTINAGAGWVDGLAHNEYCSQVNSALDATGIPRN